MYRLVIAFTVLLSSCSVVSADILFYPTAYSDPGFHIIQQNQFGVELVFSVPMIDLSTLGIDGKTYTTVSLPGVMLPNQTGAPNLPSSAGLLAVPIGGNAEVEILSSTSEIITDIDIAPAFEIPWDTDDSPLKYPFNRDIYNRDADYPDSPVLVGDPITIRCVDAVPLSIMPFQYNPVQRTLKVFTELHIKVTFSGGSQFVDERLRSSLWEPVLKQQLMNYPVLPSQEKRNLATMRATDEDDNVEYLIITPDDPAFIAWGDTLKSWRNQQGILTGTATITDIGGNDDELIENYIDLAYMTWDIPPVAVLLLSDYQQSGDQYGIDAPIYDNYCVSDNMYADVDGNQLPNLFIGRITAQDPQDLENMIGKLLEYERNPVQDPGFYDHPCIAGGWQEDRWFILCTEILWGYFNVVQGKNPPREYAGATSPPTYWSSNPNTQMVIDTFGPNGLGYIPETPEYLVDWGGNAERINGDINDGAFLTVHRDHGDIIGWASPQYEISDLSGLTNDEYTYVFTINCLTGKFNSPTECFAEAFVRMQHGAIGAMAASEVSYSFVNDTFVWGVWDSMWPDFYPYYGLYPDPQYALRPGIANLNAKYFLWLSSWPSNPGNKEVTYHLMHHHGDVFLQLYSEVPEDIFVYHSPTLVAGVDYMWVTTERDAQIGFSVNGDYWASATGTGSPIRIGFQPLSPGDTLRITVTMANHNRYIADVPVIPDDGPYVAYFSNSVEDSSGNNNGEWDYLETVGLTVSLINGGTQIANNVIASLICSDTLVTILDGTESYGTMGVGEVVTIENAFVVQANPNTPDEHTVEFMMQAASGPQLWQSYFDIDINAPEIQFDSLHIYDPLGNNDNTIDPGETVDFQLFLRNTGHAEASDITVIMMPTDSLVTVHNNPGQFGVIEPGNNASFTYQVTADESIVPGTYVDISLDISAYGEYVAVDSFSIKVGDLLDLPSGPDSYGYYAYDNNDVNGSHPYEWIEIAPAAGGPGTLLNPTTSNQSFSVSLPFSFDFYGQTNLMVTVCTNGWLCLGYTTSTAFLNAGLPSLNGPGSMVSAFWYDLDPTQPDAQMCYYYDETNHLFIVEWYNVPHSGASIERETFEVVLKDPGCYPSVTGDGISYVQYHTVSNANVGTFGIEDPSETIGLQYCYNGDYDEHAWPIEAGRTITYTTGSTASTPDVTVSLTPVGQPIQIPANGGSFDFNILVENVSGAAQTVDIWCDATLPNGSIIPPLVGPVNLNLPSGFTGDRDRTQLVPDYAPPGIYTYNAYSGTYPDIIWDQDSFDFEKLTTAGGMEVSEWLNSGEPFDPWLETVEATDIPEAFSLRQNYPNPFNPTTSITFDLPVASEVTFDVFDINGRSVGPQSSKLYLAGQHSIVFDGSELSSGIYIYRLKAGEFTGTGKMVLLK